MAKEIKNLGASVRARLLRASKQRETRFDFILNRYALETVIAEKFHAMVVFGIVNSRIKDYVDIFHLSQSFKFERLRITEAILATFKNRQTEIPTDVPSALSASFYQ